jgi:galactose mutarotase-like enzyme
MLQMADVRIEPDPEVPGRDRYVLATSSSIEVAFVPTAGMVGTSMTLHGRELLGRRGGLADYVTHGKTFGIPLLAPWANRLANPVQSFDGRSWTVQVGDPGVHPDEFNQPIHGLLSACDAWVVDEFAVGGESAQLVAHLNFDTSLDLFRSFPFEHSLTVVASLTGSTLRVDTTLRPTGADIVPVAFGWHPYFTLPDTPRALWQIDAPFTERAELNDVNIPTGRILSESLPSGALGDLALDDVFVNVVDGSCAQLRGTEAQITVRYVSGYPTAVVFAPVTADVVCFEPMTAPTDPFSGHWPIRSVPPGQEYVASFEIEVGAAA